MTARLIITNASNYSNEVYSLMDGKTEVILRPGESHQITASFSGSGVRYLYIGEPKEVLVVVDGKPV